jgi:hypothetical protein
VIGQLSGEPGFGAVSIAVMWGWPQLVKDLLTLTI